MGIEWAIAEVQAKSKARHYANARGYDEGSVHWTNQYNAFLAGYLENAGERESLRVINARLQKKLEDAKVPFKLELAMTPQSELNDLDGLI